MRDESLLLKDIHMALDRIDSSTRGMSYEEFAADDVEHHLSPLRTESFIDAGEER
jgi:uncharacterized protein with HEPN domain